MSRFTHAWRWLALVVDAAMIPASIALAARVPGTRTWVGWLVTAWLFALLAVTWRAGASLIVSMRRALGDRTAAQSMIDRADPGGAAARTLIGVFAYRQLLKNLVLKDLKLKYRGSVFGFLWSLVNPLLMILVYAAAFTFILRVRAEGFVFFLLLGVLAWTFFANSASMSTGAIVDSAGPGPSCRWPRSSSISLSTC